MFYVKEAYKRTKIITVEADLIVWYTNKKAKKVYDDYNEKKSAFSTVKEASNIARIVRVFRYLDLLWH